MSASWVWVDGVLTALAASQVSILTHTLHYGSGVFEGIRAYNGRVFKLSKHLERFHASANTLGFTLPYDVPTLIQATQHVMVKNALKDAYVRPLAWYDDASLKLNTTANALRVMIAAWPVIAHVTTALAVTWGQWLRPTPAMSPIQAKACGPYMISVIERNRAIASGFDDAILKDCHGHVAECTGANIFMVKDNQLYTPEATYVLNGITRQTVMALAKRMNIPVHVAPITPSALLLADGVFITGTAAEIRPITRIDDQPMAVSPIMLNLQAAYHTMVRSISDDV
jgi:branched-chain amino acid aminotransferase group I